MGIHKRLEELDSMRGLAAVSVVFAHISIILPSTDFLERLNHTPVHFFWLGHESVILFFILSGYVLSLPYFINKNVPYLDYVIKRICRIMIPSIVSIIIALLLMQLLSPHEIPTISEWGNSIWTSHVSGIEILNHIFLINETDTMKINPVLWSLIHEMRISLVFPLIVYILHRSSMLKSILFALAIPVLLFAGYYIILKATGFDITMFKGDSSFLLTPHYMAFFILGGILAKHRKYWSGLYSKLGVRRKVGLLCAGLGLYMYNWLMLPDSALPHLFIIDDWAIAMGACIFIVFALNSSRISRILMIGPIHFTGRISYSLYLYHLIVMIALVHTLGTALPLWAILVLSLPLSLLCAAIMHRMVEGPSIVLGRFLTTNRRKADPQLTEKRYSAS
ncbi:acyltransferase family protein [Paenibacillus sp. sgz500958]|uniref:acyltransferase family protein n=1 Tax=Paenibacillus sp. sgz500958 TaxID=3242475 RepID=UPI0036D31964